MTSFFSIYTKIENPTLGMVFFTFLLSFCLSGLLAFTYQKTTLVASNSRSNFLQSLILGALIATMVLQAIGDNVASGLAMLGALNIVQFRTKLSTPRESIFMFSALGVGISCGLFGFFIAILGTFVFCFVAFTMRFTHLQEQPVPLKPTKPAKKTEFTLKIGSDEHIRLHADFEGIMSQYCSHWWQEGVIYSQNPSSVSWRDYTFVIVFKDIKMQQDLLTALEHNNMKIVSLEIKTVIKIDKI